MGELRQRGNVWWIRYYRNGRRYEESSGSKKKGKAIELLRIRESWRAWSPGDAEHRPRALRAAGEGHRQRVRRERPEVAQPPEAPHQTAPGAVLRCRRMAAVTTSDVRAFIAQRQEATASNAEVNRELAALKRMYTLAVQSGRLLHRPHILMLEERNVRAGFFERAQFDAVRSHLPTDLRNVATFAYVTGWRVPSEVLTLQWRQVDFKAGVVRLEPDTTKNEEGRRFPFDTLPELKAALQEQQQAKTEG
jgi:integrase